MMNKPSITTIIPTFNRAALLKKAVESVLSQSHKNFQVIISDNASSDETSAVLEKLVKTDSRVIVHRQQNNIGGLNNFNFLLGKIDSDYFSILSDDDYLLPGFFENALHGFARHPEAFFGSLKVFDNNPTGIPVMDHFSKSFPEGFFPPPQGLIKMTEIGVPTWTGTLFRKEIFEKIGSIDPEIPIIDFDFLLRAALKVPFFVSKANGAVFTSHSLIDLKGSRGSPSAYWPVGKKIIGKLTSENILSVEEKKKIEENISGMLLGFVYLTGMSAVFRNDIEDIKLAQKYLSETGRNKLRKKISITWNLNNIKPGKLMLGLARKLNKIYYTYKYRQELDNIFKDGQ
ncbi:MAG: glycosyltransferase family 2 protein [Candidatus Riflebacteria bacterium]|nr:glycosyltransferase family 2 protein [Candidatus Riflebacteria bacterium]